MYRHFILVGESYTLGTRVGWSTAWQGKVDVVALNELVDSLKFHTLRLDMDSIA